MKNSLCDREQGIKHSLVHSSIFVPLKPLHSFITEILSGLNRAAELQRRLH